MLVATAAANDAAGRRRRHRRVVRRAPAQGLHTEQGTTRRHAQSEGTAKLQTWALLEVYSKRLRICIEHGVVH